MDDTKIVEKIMRTLSDQYTYIVVAIEESKDITTMTVDELQSSLNTHAHKLNRKNKTEEDQVLKVEDRFGGRGRFSYRGRGGGRGRQSYNKSTIECFKCHKMGHFQYECPNWKEAHFTAFEDEDDLLLMASVNHARSERQDMWFIDSGCSNHMCNDGKMFTALDRSFNHSVKLGNNSRLNVARKGVVKLMLKGISYAIGEVYYVPDLKNNLLSVGQLQEKGLSVTFKNGKCNIQHPRRGEIVEADMSLNRMFVVFSEEECNDRQQEECLQTTSNETFKLWHERFGHLSTKGMHTL
ncbi:hypothetical protein LIER_25494 [Lithospermum erythrorhizon]|uniref:CCHC-type domain-containing protein n=1 Tax=Lithospermum erythrorhizon TaxID=34254 RepID=A0AAV3R693_LITER